MIVLQMMFETHPVVSFGGGDYHIFPLARDSWITREGNVVTFHEPGRDDSVITLSKPLDNAQLSHLLCILDIRPSTNNMTEHYIGAARALLHRKGPSK